MDGFKFESSNYEDLEAARWLRERECGRLTPPGVDLTSGELLSDEESTGF
jgi:hypothetical protein